MTDSTVKPRYGKRARLIASAMDLLHRQGLHKPTLAEIAVAADVPPGNVYYYFKSRDDLVRAVVGTRIDQQRAMFTELEAAPEPRARLQGSLQIWVDEREMLTAYGCPLAGLHADLYKIGGDLADEAAKLIEMRIDWIGDRYPVRSDGLRGRAPVGDHHDRLPAGRFGRRPGIAGP
jgi:TetR/AcrR family transcriptional regulator, transcriptional repressor for nem operon